MKTRFILFAAFISCAWAAAGQEVSKLNIPGTPAFSILNFEPSAVMRPATAKSLAADVLNAFDEEGKLRMNLGLEVAPYWLKSHPTLKRETYLHPNVGQAFLQSISVSAATVRDSVTKQNKFGGGFRFRLLNGDPVAELQTASTELGFRTTVVDIINNVRAGMEKGTTRQQAVNTIVAALRDASVPVFVVDSFQKQARTLMVKSTDESEAGVKKFLQKLMDDRIEAYKGMAQNVSRLLYRRQGLILEFAGATGYARRRTTDLDKIGVWANATYSAAGGTDLLTATVRYMYTNNDSSLNNLDVGIGYLKTAPQFNFSFEALLRHYRAEINDRNLSGQPIKRVAKEFTYRVALQASYMIAKEVSINLSLGKDFNTPFISGSGFFSVAGLNFSIFHKEPMPPVTEN